MEALKRAIRLFRDLCNLARRGTDNDHWILAGGYYQIGDYKAALQEIASMQNPAPALRLSAAAMRCSESAIAAHRLRGELMEYNPGFNLAQWLSIIPCNDSSYVQHYSHGLRMAGFV